MLSGVHSYVLQGIDALPCEVELDLDDVATPDESRKSTIVGLPDTGVKEAIERVKSALANSGYSWPRGRAVINLAPADVRKEGPVYDLPIAVGALLVQGVIAGASGRPRFKGRLAKDAQATAENGAPREPLDYRRYVFAGELALDGRLRAIRGVIALAAMAKKTGALGVIVPADNAAEAAVVPGIEVYGARTLNEVVGLLTGNLDVDPVPTPDIESLLQSAAAPVDFADVRGQEAVKRAIIVAAAGGHNILPLWPSGGRGGGRERPCRTVGHRIFQLWPCGGRGEGGSGPPGRFRPGFGRRCPWPRRGFPAGFGGRLGRGRGRRAVPLG
ncbi:MAG: ATP-binding protein [Phycisphaerales bacterium]|nr:ATP-binding protein [Phycisphaerales bacterium]